MNKVLNISWEAMLPNLPDQSFDLAITDIPYGINAGKMNFINAKKMVRQKNGEKLPSFRHKKHFAPKEWDSKPPGQDYFDELRRVSKHQIIFGINYVNWTGVGTGRIIWDKLVAEGVGFSRYEVAYCSLIENEVTIPLLWSGMMQAESLEHPTKMQGNKKLNEKRIHPCHKPVMLYDRLLMDYGFKGMKLLDTHVGGGSIRISADKFVVSEFLGSEIDPDHFSDQEKRWNDYKNQLTIQY